MKTVVIFSGGLDSTVALTLACKQGDTEALTFNYGSKHNARENAAAEKIAKQLGVPHKLISLDFIASSFRSDLLLTGADVPSGHYADAVMRRTVVPFRNAIMLSVAVGYAESIGAGRVVIGAHAGDHDIYPDCRPTFLGAFASAAREGTYARVELVTPFQDMRKEDIVKAGVTVSTPFGLTYSCYRGQEKHCGTCGTCVERKEAFALAEVVDPTEYYVA